MDPLTAAIDTFRQWFQNIGILVMVILLYNVIPISIYQGKKILFTLLVGLIFGFAAIMGILIPWSGTTHPVIGINGVLIPLAGLVGGLISAGIVTIILFFIRVIIEGGVGITPDLVLACIAAITGSAFHAGRTRGLFRYPPFWDLVLLSSLFTFMTMVVLGVFPPLDSFGKDFGPLKDVDTAMIIFIGVLLLGWIILSINQRKEDEITLANHQEHLEDLVRERTADLERINVLQQATLESTVDGIVVIDYTGIVRGYNRTAARILDIRSLEEMQEDQIEITRLLTYHIQNGDKSALFPLIQPTDDPLYTTDLTFRSGRVYELFITPYRLRGDIIGRVLNFRDITGKKHAEDLLKNMNQKLLLLSGITRHDILNQITALKIYLYLLRNDPEEAETVEFMARMDNIIRMMQHQTESTGEYQESGLHEPVWQHPPTVFHHAAASFPDRDISCQSELMTLEILADPLLERAFYNLIDNSLRHGGHVSHISLSFVQSGEDLRIIYQDDGTGVVPEEKEKIFKKGFGKHTGFGMFLIHEILSITGITITECGDYGAGARFEIRVPQNSVRPLSPNAILDAQLTEDH